MLCFFVIKSVLSSLCDSFCVLDDEFLSRLDLVLLLLLLQLLEAEKTNDELFVAFCWQVDGDEEAGWSDNGEVAAEGCIEEVAGFMEQSAIDEEDNDEQ